MLTDYERKLSLKLNLSENFFELLKDNTIAGENDQILIRSDKGEVFRRCNNPAVLFYSYDSTGNFSKEPKIFRIDEYKTLKRCLLKTKEILASFNDEIADSVSDSLVLLELPKNQLLIDSVSNNVGYLSSFINRCNSFRDLAVTYLNSPLDLEA